MPVVSVASARPQYRRIVTSQISNGRRQTNHANAKVQRIQLHMQTHHSQGSPFGFFRGWLELGLGLAGVTYARGPGNGVWTQMRSSLESRGPWE